MHLLNRHIAILLIGILAIQAEGALVIHQVRQGMIQYKVRRGIRHNEFVLEVLTMSTDGYARSKRPKNEIMVDGKMYDVKSVSTNGDVVTLEVVHDKAEEGVLKKIKDFFTPDKDSSGKIPKHVQQLLSAKYVPPMRQIFSELIFQAATHIYFLHAIGLTIVRDIPSPPPR